MGKGEDAARPAGTCSSQLCGLGPVAAMCLDMRMSTHALTPPGRHHHCATSNQTEQEILAGRVLD